MFRLPKGRATLLLLRPQEEYICHHTYRILPGER
jgi:hypothetical protein